MIFFLSLLQCLVRKSISIWFIWYLEKSRARAVICNCIRRPRLRSWRYLIQWEEDKKFDARSDKWPGWQVWPGGWKIYKKSQLTLPWLLFLHSWDLKLIKNNQPGLASPRNCELSSWQIFIGKLWETCQCSGFLFKLKKTFVLILIFSQLGWFV